MEIRRDRRHRILNGLQWVAMVATASVLYWAFMAAWSMASLFNAFGFSDRGKAHS